MKLTKLQRNLMVVANGIGFVRLSRPGWFRTSKLLADAGLVTIADRVMRLTAAGRAALKEVEP